MEQFRISLSNRFQALQDLDEEEDQSLENKWQRTRNAWMDTCEQTVGRKTMQHKERITVETLKKRADTKSQKRRPKQQLNKS